MQHSGHVQQCTNCQKSCHGRCMLSLAFSRHHSCYLMLLRDHLQCVCALADSGDLQFGETGNRAWVLFSGCFTTAVITESSAMT